MSSGDLGYKSSTALALVMSAGLAAGLAACSGSGGGGSSSERRITMSDGSSRPAFTEDKYGVSTSPRVAAHRGTMPKGGGSYKLGIPYKVAGRWYVPSEEPGYDRQGTGSWYGDDFHGRKTANGEVFDMHALTAAHPTLPMPSYVYVTNLNNGRTILVRVNDRGPYVGDRMIDLSHASARALGYDGQGRAPVRVRYAGRAPMNGDDRRERQYLASQPWYRGGGPAIASAAAPSAPSSMNSRAPMAPPEPFPAGTAGRWSPTSYRMALAGKPLPPEAPARHTWRPAGPVRTFEPQRAEPDMSEQGALRWQASPRGQPLMRTSSVAESRPLPAGRPGSAYVQVGTYRDQANAERMRRGIGHLGPVEVAPEGGMYRVRLGPLSPADAETAQAQIAAQGVAGSRVVVD